MSTLLEIKELCGGYEQNVNILQGINLTVDESEVVGIIGLNGSGKSTLGKSVMNLIPYRKGSIIFNGQHVEDKSTHELAQLGIVLMHQGGVVFPNLSVWQNLSLALGNKADKSYYEQLEGVIPLLRKPKKELMRTMADKLSGGQRHELALAMTLAREPKLAILDEPSAGLTPKAVTETYEALSIIRNVFKISMLIIEQNIMRLMEVCTQYVILESGSVFAKNNDLDIYEIESIIFKV